MDNGSCNTRSMPTADDVEALQRQLDALRQVPRQLLSVTSTQLTQAAALHHADPKGRVLLLLARVLYVIAEEDQHAPDPERRR